VSQRIEIGGSQERTRAAVLRPFVEQADWLLDLHSMHERAEPLLLTGLHPRNQTLARSLRTPQHVVIDAGHKDGVHMRDFGRFGWPDVKASETRSSLLECGFHGDVSSRIVVQNMLVRFLLAAGTLDPEDVQHRLPDWRQPDVPGQEEPVLTPYDHCSLVMPLMRQAQAGVTVVRFATRQLL
jgi:predicted deacylase